MCEEERIITVSCTLYILQLLQSFIYKSNAMSRTYCDDDSPTIMTVNKDTSFEVSICKRRITQ